MKASAGFTLVEILVAVVIFVLITGMVLVTYQGSIRNGQNQAARAHGQQVAQVANTWFAARPDINAHNYNGIDCKTNKTYAPWGVVEGHNAGYPTHGNAPTGTQYCYLTATSSRSIVVNVQINDLLFVEGQ